MSLLTDIHQQYVNYFGCAHVVVSSDFLPAFIDQLGATRWSIKVGRK